jgi:hypothetical protein
MMKLREEGMFTLAGAFDSVSNTDGLAVGEIDSLFHALAFIGIVFEMRHGKSGFVLEVLE